MAAFTDELHIRDMRDGVHFLLLTPLGFQSDELGMTVHAPAGFVTDFASTPMGTWNIFPKVGNYDYAAVIHDAGYELALVDDAGKTIILTKKQCDSLFLEGMKVCGVGRFHRNLMSYAVRIFGKGKVRDIGVTKSESTVGDHKSV